MREITLSTINLIVDAVGIIVSIIFAIIGDKLNIALFFAFAAMFCKDIEIRKTIKEAQ